MIEIKVPTVGESINEVTLVKWLKNDGDYVERDEVIAELESEKATFEVNAEQAGVLKTVSHEGDTLNIGDVLAKIDDQAARPGGNGVQKSKDKEQETRNKEQEIRNKEQETTAEAMAGKLATAEAATGKPATSNQQPATSNKATPVASAI